MLELKSKWEELELATLLLSHLSLAGEAAPAWLKCNGQREETGSSHFCPLSSPSCCCLRETGT